MAELKSSDKLKKFCFTLNNYSEAEYQALIEHGRNKCLFMVVGRETGASNTSHLQGYCNLIKQVRFSAVKKALPRAHIEKAQGTDEQNLAYCTKQDSSAFVFGEPQRGGKRNDLKKTCDRILAGAPLATVAVEHPEVYVKYTRGLQSLVQAIQKPRDVNDPPMTLWLWGSAGVGKTRFAYDQLPHNEIYMKDGTQWWDGYTNQQCILIDDFDGHWPFRDFLRLLDRYPYKGQYKGGYVEINSPIIIITCEFAPEHYWQMNELAQVTRRLQHIVHME